jgi:integrase
MISKNPLDNVKTTKPAKAVDDINFLTVQEQEKFLDAAKNTHNYYQYAFLLETGLRTGELVGLTWDCVDWENRLLTVRKTLEYRYGVGYWRAGPPKSKSGYRTIPLTSRAYEILEILYAQIGSRKESSELSTVLKFMDIRTGKTDSFVMRDLVFINYRTGLPAKNSSYDTHLERLCKGAGLRHISMHTLRHTYATRAIERDMNPKVLQRLLGHSSIQQTMDRYVHVSQESLQEAVRRFEQGA